MLGSAGVTMWDLVRGQPSLDRRKLWTSCPFLGSACQAEVPPTVSSGAAPPHCTILADAMQRISWEEASVRAARLDDLGWPGSGTLRSQLGAEWRLGGAALTKKPKDRK